MNKCILYFLILLANAVGISYSMESPRIDSKSFKKYVHEILENTAIGGISGAITVGIVQPMISLKNYAQTDTKVPLNPRLWYRGVYGLAASYTPSVILQTITHGFLSDFISPLYASVYAGAISAAVVCPAEGIMIQQQKMSRSFWDAASGIYAHYGIKGLYRGLIPTAAREGAFTAGYLGVVPALKEKLKDLGLYDWQAQIGAGITAGTTASVISHPFDTYKTRLQANYSYKESLLKGLVQADAFKGLGWRTALIATATTVMPYLQEKLKNVKT